MCEMSSVFGRGGDGLSTKGRSAAERWVYESHNQAPLLDNPGGGYERMCTRVCTVAGTSRGRTRFIRYGPKRSWVPLSLLSERCVGAWLGNW